MTDAEINIAIAKVCGWKPFSRDEGCWQYRNSMRIVLESDLPDYCNDLNAMREAERIGWLNKSRYMDMLEEVIDSYLVYHLVTATARQRAEAFLRALNLWKE